MWTEGQQFGRFTLSRELGAGSFAEVWLAVETSQLGFRKEVALKLLRATDADKVEALQQEARLVAALRHPNIVDVLAVEQIEGTWTVVMEYVDGGTLQQLVERVALAGLALPVSVVLDLGLDITRALGRAHTATDPDGQTVCVLHRDLKPANVLIDSAGVAKLTDFGVAKVVGAAVATATGTAKGTPAYIAPESWAGSRDFAPPVDLFGLGCIVWELVTLRRLFDAETITAIFWQMANRAPAEEVGPLRARAAGLAPVVERLLAREPDDRYQSAAEVERDLVALRAAQGPSGDLGRFLELLARAEQGGPPASESPLPHVPETDDTAWRQIVVRAGGEPWPDRPPREPLGGVPDLADTETMASLPELEVTEAMRRPPELEATDVVGPPAGSVGGGATGRGAAAKGEVPGQADGGEGAGDESGDRARQPASRGGQRRRRRRGADGGRTRRKGEGRPRRGGAARSLTVVLLAITALLAVALVVVLLLPERSPAGGDGGPAEAGQGAEAGSGSSPADLSGAVDPGDLEVAAGTGSTPGEGADEAVTPTPSAATPRSAPSLPATRATPTPGRDPGAAATASTPRPAGSSPAEPTPSVGAATPSAGAGANPTPTPAAATEPTPVAAQPTPAPTPVAAQPTPAPTPAAAQPTPAGGGVTEVPSTACLVTTSSPARASVWIDGAPQSRRALGAGSRLGARAAPGWVTVGMGTGERPTAWLDVELVLGKSSAVHCDLEANSCTLSTGDYGPCRR